MREQPNQVLLTFDVEGLPPKEDFLDNVSLTCVARVLDLLEKKNLRGIFFITGTIAEEIRKYPDIVERLSCHEIGYHSSSHSRPTIIEYTDVADYEEAVSVSLKRETSHINPKTGRIGREDGILSLRETFPKNAIRCFRAPFLGWSPPHLEALKHLGIIYDFSSNISHFPVRFRGITFYPYPVPIDGVVRTFVHKGPGDFLLQPITSVFLRKKVTVLSMHPSNLPIKNLFASADRLRVGGEVRTKVAVSFLRLLLDRIQLFQKTNLIEVTSSPTQNWQSLNPEEIDVESVYQRSVENVIRLFDCNPRYIFLHFMRFLN